MDKSLNNDPLAVMPDTSMEVGVVPSDIETFLIENSIPEDQYTCRIFRKEAGKKKILPGLWDSEYPTTQDMGKKFGPGDYVINFTFKQTREDGKVIPGIKEFPITLGEEWDQEHAEYAMTEAVKHKQKTKSILKTAQLTAAMDGEDLNKKDADPIEMLRENAKILKELGAATSQVPARSDDSKEMMLMFMKMSQDNQAQQQQNMQTMMTGMMGMVTAIIQSNGNNNNNANPMEYFKEAMTMTREMTSLKNELSPEKQTVMDRVFGALEIALPGLLQIAHTKGVAAAKANPMVSQAASSPELQQVLQDPEMSKEAIDRLVKDYGPADTNNVLETLGVGVRVNAEGQAFPITNMGGEQASPSGPMFTEGEGDGTENLET